MKRDVQETAKRNFFDPRSYVAKDGREVLYGLDWKQRVGELRQRSGGQCERMWKDSSDSLSGSYIRCRSGAADPHHKIRRSVLRDDRLSNLEALCRLHHELEDERKPRWSKKGAKVNPG